MTRQKIINRKGYVRKGHSRNGKWINQTYVRSTSYRNTLSSKNNINNKKKRNPRVFFSFDWPNCWRSNQIKNQTYLNSNKKANFINKSLLEKNKAANEKFIKKKIRDGINKAGIVAIINSPTYNGRPYTNYEQNYAIKNNKKMIVINSHNMKDKNGELGEFAPKPDLCKMFKIPSRTYTPGRSNLKDIILDAKKPS